MGLLTEALKGALGQGVRGGVKPIPVPVPVPVPLPVPKQEDNPVPVPEPEDDKDRRRRPRTQDRRRVRPRNSSCCDPKRFRTEWPKGVRAAVGETGNYEAYEYQVITCGAKEYHCHSTTAKPVWADGLMENRCWMKDAKHSRASDKSLFRLDKLEDRPYIFTRTLDEFRRYGAAANNPAPPAKPCWGIALRIITNFKENVPFFEEMLDEYNLWGDIIVRSIDWMDKGTRDMLMYNRKNEHYTRPWVKDSENL